MADPSHFKHSVQSTDVPMTAGPPPAPAPPIPSTSGVRIVDPQQTNIGVINTAQQLQESSHHTFRPTLARDKSIMCSRFFQSGCDVVNCPFAHYRQGTVLSVPEAMCRFHKPNEGSTCKRDGCPFFHGSVEAFRHLQGSGTTTYRPEDFLQRRDPLAIHQGDPVSNIQPDWHQVLDDVRAWSSVPLWSNPGGGPYVPIQSYPAGGVVQVPYQQAPPPPQPAPPGTAHPIMVSPTPHPPPPPAPVVAVPLMIPHGQPPPPPPQPQPQPAPPPVGPQGVPGAQYYYLPSTTPAAAPPCFSPPQNMRLQ